MRKAAAAMVAAFMTGGAVMALLGTLLGPLSEPAVLGLVGLSLYAGSTLLQSRLEAPHAGARGPSGDASTPRAAGTVK